MIVVPCPQCHGGHAVLAARCALCGESEYFSPLHGYVVNHRATCPIFALALAAAKAEHARAVMRWKP